VTTSELDAQTRTDLEDARALALAGVPLFLAHPDPTNKTGFTPPRGWERTAPDPTVVDRWRPGLALCAVMGHGLDLADFDPRNGGDPAALNGSAPRTYAVAATPSGGTHWFIASLGTGSRDNVLPGVDVKSGLPDGTGRGFAFLAPTVRASVVTGTPAAYRWVQRPDLTALRSGDDSGAALAAKIRELRSASNAVRGTPGGPAWWQEFLTSNEAQSVPAANRAIDDKLADVAAWTADSGAGFRLTLLRAALTLGGYVGGGHLDEHDARTRLEDAAAQVWGSVDSDDQLWIQQGLDDGAVQPFRVFDAEEERANSAAAQAVAAQGEDPPPAADEPPAPPVDPPWNVYAVLDPGTPFDPVHDATDQGLAKAVAYRMYPALRYAKDAGLWIKRERDVWEEAKDDGVVTDWIVSLMAELMPLGSTPVPKEHSERTEGHWQAIRRAQFMSSAGTGKIGRKLRAIVRSDHPATLRIADLDSNPDVLWAGGVPWDLRASLSVPTPAHWIDPSTPHLRAALCAPDPTVATPRWDAFTAAVLPDPDARAWALRVLSIALTGYADAALPVLYGRERSGKTSLIEMIVQVLGSYARAANPKLLNGSDSSHDAIIYDLKGRRLAFIDEGPKRGHEATERLKQLTGGGSLTASAKYANPITFAPVHTLVMTTNNEPHLTDPALRARMRLIPCDQPEELVRPARLPLLGRGLLQEAPGILAALMREAAGYLDDRDTAGTAAAPTSIRGLAQEMAEGQDPIREWVDLCTVPSEPGTPGRALYTEFARWHQDSPLFRRMSVPTETAFGRVLTEMGHASTKVAGRWYRPLSVLHGPGGVGAPIPSPAAFMTGPGGYLAGLGGSVAGSPRQPAEVYNPTSTPILPSSSGGLAGIDNRNRERESSRYIGEYSEIVPAAPAARGESAPKRGVTCDDEGWRVPAPGPATGPIGSEGVADEAGTPGEDPGDPSDPAAAARAERNALTREAAARAHTDKITKAEARRVLAEEKRLAAVVEAQGEVLGLPAVVDRAGNVLPVTLEQADAVVRQALARAGRLDVDVETSGYPVGHPLYALRSVQLGDEVAAVVLHPLEHADLIRTLLAEAPALGAFSATADLVPLAHAGLGEAESLWDRMHDVVIPAKLADPQSTGAGVDGLKKLAPAVLGPAAVSPTADAGRAELWKAGRWLKETKVATPVERSGWAQVETGSATMLRYAASDVLDTAALGRVLPLPAPGVYERERLAQRMTARIAHRGVRLDAEHIDAMTGPAQAGRAQAGDQVRTFGIENPGSDQQIGKALLGLGATLPRSAKTGAPSVAAGVLEPLRGSEGPVGALVNAVLDYRHHDTVLGTFLEPYRLLCEQGDGRARPTVYTLGTDTGRMSCVRPNLQQLSREGGVRACITADPGQLMIGADFSGVELRVAAALSQDPTLLAFLAEGRDLHGEIALQVWGADPAATAKAGGVPTASKANRYVAKRGVFGRIYGGGIATLAAQVGVGQDVMQQVIDTLDALTPQLSAWSASVSSAVKRGATQFESYSGRVIHLPADRPHAAPNYCIQGSARELLVDTLVRWRDTRWGACTLLPVHDELDVFVPEAEAVEATAELVRCMETELMGVKIVADPSEPSFFWRDST
jgi:P4 family phage/plasmid primase-like protien